MDDQPKTPNRIEIELRNTKNQINKIINQIKHNPYKEQIE
jgi:hypothetical protein